MSHKTVPEFVEMFHRYQCKACHSWVFYDEQIGSWWHQSEKNAVKVWDGSAWILETAAPPLMAHPQTWGAGVIIED